MLSSCFRYDFDNKGLYVSNPASIYSMTGFAVVNEELSHATLTVELRAVNNRYLDIQLR